MSSILTNYGAMIALQNLEATQMNLTDTQQQISSGLKVNTAKDDASARTISTTMKANVASLNQVGTDLGNADSILGTAVSGANQITNLVSQIRAKVASYTDTSTNQTATQSEVTQLVNQINAIIQSSAFNGVNLLDGSNASGLTFVAATNNSYAGTSVSSTPGAGVAAPSPTIATGTSTNLAVNATNSNATVSAFNTLVTALSSNVSSSTLDTSLQTIDNYNNLVETQAAQFGAVQQNVESQQTFVKDLANTMQGGISNMVDADMTAESARLTALQTQQQLGAQALSIANQAPALILKLFGG
jgi:flagellin